MSRVIVPVAALVAILAVGGCTESTFLPQPRLDVVLRAVTRQV